MYKQCATEATARRQQHIEQTLLHLLQTQRYDTITVTQLCTVAALPRKAFYRYFDSKEDVLHALIDHTMLQYEAFTPPCACHPLERYFLFWLHHRPLLDGLQRSGLSSVLIERSIQFASLMFRSRFVPLYAENNQKINASELFITSGLLLLTINWHHAGCRESAQAMAAVVVDLLTQPLFAPLDAP